ncbi:fumarate hydratase, partial [Aquabacterium sp.]|uniref:fumarate hydratase n=1 Tax=Aquabacterium sp. TaxID=1872578 RepID=UPI002CB6CE67
MTIRSEQIRDLTADLYEWSLKKVPDDMQRALRAAGGRERGELGRATIAIMVDSAQAAESSGGLVCSDIGIPVYSLKVGTRVRFDGPVKQAIVDGFALLAARIDPPILKMVTNPLTHERSHSGKDIPIVTVDLIDDADYVEITCAPKAMGTG